MGGFRPGRRTRLHHPTRIETAPMQVCHPPSYGLYGWIRSFKQVLLSLDCGHVSRCPSYRVARTERLSPTWCNREWVSQLLAMMTTMSRISNYWRQCNGYLRQAFEHLVWWVKTNSAKNFGSVITWARDMIFLQKKSVICYWPDSPTYMLTCQILNIYKLMCQICNISRLTCQILLFAHLSQFTRPFCEFMG